jgi:hypothetical protein
MSLDDAEISDGLSRTPACELAGACQVGEESLKLLLQCGVKAVVQFESGFSGACIIKLPYIELRSGVCHFKVRL